MFKKVTFLIILAGSLFSLPTIAADCTNEQRLNARDEALIAVEYLRDFIQDGKHFDNAELAVVHLELLLQAAKICGADMYMLDQQKIGELERAARLTHAVRQVANLAQFTIDPSRHVADWLIARAQEAVDEAGQHQANVEALKTQLAILVPVAEKLDAQRRAVVLQNQDRSTTLVGAHIEIVDPKRHLNLTRQVVGPAPEKEKVKRMPAEFKQATLHDQ